MNCPYCGGELTRGFIQCRDGLFWTPKRQLIAALSVWGKGRVALYNDSNLTFHTAHALRCTKCGLVLIPPEESPLLK